MPVTLIATVLNEGESIRVLMDSIAAQNRRPDAIILCDGGSTDNTIPLLEEYAGRLPLTIIHKAGANISEGRNAAIRAATNDLIAVTDAGVRLEADWLGKIIKPLEDMPQANVVAGFFRSDPQTAFEVALGATTLPDTSEINLATFLPSSRSVAFRRSAWEAVGGYPEWLDYCEDLIFDFRLKAAAGAFVFAPDAVVHFRPRETLGAFVRQYYQYARGDGKAGLFFRRHAIRYLTYLAALPLICAASIWISPLWLAALAMGGAVMVATPYRRLIRQWGGLNAAGKVMAAVWVPIIRVAGDIGKMVGYPVGVVWRAKNHPPDWRETNAECRMKEVT